MYSSSINYLSSVVGLYKWYNLKYWYGYKFPYSPDAAIYVAKSFASNLFAEMSGHRVTLLPHRHWNHGKVWLFDRTVSAIGSFNFDQSAEEWTESVLVCHDPEKVIEKCADIPAMHKDTGFSINDLEEEDYEAAINSLTQDQVDNEIRVMIISKGCRDLKIKYKNCKL